MHHVRIAFTEGQCFQCFSAELLPPIHYFLPFVCVRHTAVALISVHMSAPRRANPACKLLSWQMRLVHRGKFLACLSIHLE